MENILFKQSFRGFDRTQVLEYIDGLSNEMSQQAENYNQIQKGLEEEIRTLSEKLSLTGENLNISQEKVTELTINLAGIKQDNIQLKKQVNTYRSMLLAKDKEISEIKQNYNRLSEKKDMLEKENADWKSRQDEIAACMVEASVRAKQIINRATEEARRTKAEFDANAADLMGKVKDVKTEISRLEQQLERSFAQLSTAMENMDKASTVIENQVNDYITEVDMLDVSVESAETPSPAPVAKPAPAKQTAPAKKSLTDSVLDTISKLLEK